MIGQDISTGTRRSAPSEPAVDGGSEESRRSTEQVKLRLSPSAALRLRTAAERSGRSFSDFVVTLLDRRAEEAGNEALPIEYDTLMEISRLSHAVSSLSEEARLVRGDLGRSLGLVKHLFTIASGSAQQHKDELREAVLLLCDAIRKADSVMDNLDEALVPLRPELDAAAKRIARLS